MYIFLSFFLWLCWVLGVALGIFIKVHGLFSCVAKAQQLWNADLVAPQHMGSQSPNQGSNACPAL